MRAGLDDNTVNLEKMTLMAENTLMYMAVSQFWMDGLKKDRKRAID